MLFKLPVSISISIAFHCDFIAWLVGWLVAFVCLCLDSFYAPESHTSWQNCISKSICSRIAGTNLQWFFRKYKYICKMVVMTRFRLYVLLFLETSKHHVQSSVHCVQPRESSIDSPLYFENDLRHWRHPWKQWIGWIFDVIVRCMCVPVHCTLRHILRFSICTCTCL